MRVVIDTNVFVSSFFGGYPRKVVDLWKNGQITICLTKEIVDEYVEVLQRIGLEDEKELLELLSLFARGYNCHFSAKTPDLKIVNDDPDDDKFFECAVTLNAKCIISGDASIIAVEEYMGIKVFTPKQFFQHTADSNS